MPFIHVEMIEGRSREQKRSPCQRSDRSGF